MKLYVAGETGSSARAISNLRKIAADHFGDQAVLEIIDIRKQPKLAVEDRILATPTLVATSPPPPRRVIGDLSDHEGVIFALGLHDVQRTEGDRI